MSRLLWPDLEPEAVAEGWLAEAPPMKAGDVLDAIAKRHPMDGYGGEPGRWVFVREMPEATGGQGQRFDAVAVGLAQSTNYARVIYEVKVSRADWLRELKPQAVVRDKWGERRIGGQRAEAILRNAEMLPEYRVSEGRKWDAALALSTEFYIAAPPMCVQLGELPPEAGLVEVRMWRGELRPRVVRKAPVRDTPNPGPGFWAAVIRRAAGIREAPA